MYCKLVRKVGLVVWRCRSEEWLVASFKRYVFHIKEYFLGFLAEKCIMGCLLDSTGYLDAPFELDNFTFMHVIYYYRPNFPQLLLLSYVCTLACTHHRIYGYCTERLNPFSCCMDWPGRARGFADITNFLPDYTYVYTNTCVLAASISG